MIAAVDIGGTKIAVGIVDSDGRVLSRLSRRRQPDNGYANALDRMVNMLRDASASAGAEINGIGIGSTGPVYPFTGEFGDVNFFPQLARPESGQRSGAYLPRLRRHGERR